MAERKLVWTAEEIEQARVRFLHPLDEGAEAQMTPLSRIAQMTRTGVNLVRVPPGRRAFPTHRHYVEEEWVYILSGTADVRLDGGTRRLGAGGFAAFPPGGPAHSVANASGSEDLVCLMGGENARAEIVDFPEAGRRVVRGPGLLDDAPAAGFAPFDFFSRSPLPERAP